VPELLALPDAIAGRAEVAPPAFVCSWMDGGLNAVWMRAAGELDVATTPQLERMLRLPQLQVRLVVLDPRELDFIDCSGLRAIVNASIDARKAGHRLVVLRGAPTVERMLRLTGSLDDVEVCDVEPTGQALRAPSRRDAAR
jgi:anti-anti-sigma factor